ncbi:MAG: transcription elongation factor GreA [Eubacteriales bacterium]|nr:transcription elongation factor GreA [Eubacteriales bacterium]
MHNGFREQLTESDVKRIEDEINHRKLVVRPAALKALKEARAMGDLSENFEYYAAKRDNNLNNSRIRFLEKMLRTAVIISDKSGADEVGMNNTVDVYFEEDDCTETYRIVTSIRGNSQRGLISNESPLGKALLGHKVGDRVLIKVSPDYSYYVVIKRLEKTGDSADDRLKQY